MVFQQTDEVPLQPIIAGRYHDTFHRVDGAWYFDTREMFVDLKGVHIPPQARLEICFTAESRGRITEHRLPAYVVHEAKGGVGLMLQHVGYREFDALRYMLNAA